MPKKILKIGVLDIQGSVEEHLAALKKIGAKTVLVKNKKDLDKVSGLIIPGGESTAIGKLMRRYGLDKAIKNRQQDTGYRIQGRKQGNRKQRDEKALSIWGTCAGAILLAKKIQNPRPHSLQLMDIEIERNAYGRQVDSFETKISAPVLGRRKIPAPFIRAPRVKKASPKVKILAQYSGTPVMLRQENLLATMFHPELTDDTRVHKYFLSLTAEYAENGFQAEPQRG